MENTIGSQDVYRIWTYEDVISKFFTAGLVYNCSVLEHAGDAKIVAPGITLKHAQEAGCICYLFVSQHTTVNTSYSSSDIVVFMM